MAIARSRRLALLLGTALWMSCGYGCHAPPMTVRMDPVRAQPAHIGAATALWRGDVAAWALAEGSRVAILECSVEFVTMKQVTPTDRQAMLGGPITPVSALVDVSGVFRKRVTYPLEVLLDLPRDVHDRVVGILEERGLTVVDSAAVARTRAYRRMPAASVKHSSTALLLDPRGSDVGRAGEFRVHPAWPLRVLHDRSGDVMTAAERAILAELDAQLALRIRLRVGIYDGRVSVERGSIVTIGTGETRRRVVSDRSVVSSRLIAACDEYEVISGRRYDVDWRSFRRDSLAMVPAYVSAVLPIGKPPEGGFPIERRE